MNDQMILADAYTKAKNGDWLSVNGKRIFRKGVNAINCVIGLDRAMSSKWNIEPAEPKVLTANVIIANEKPGYKQLTTFDLEEVFNIAEAMHQNGRFERDFEYKELIESVQGIIKRNDIADRITTPLNQGILSIPPLTKEKK